jgi:hypothetical protein
MGFTPKGYEDIVTARIDYAELDIAAAPLRLRLNSTAVRVRHLCDTRASAEVEVICLRAGQLPHVFQFESARDHRELSRRACRAATKADLPESQQPHVVGRAQFGRITIANSDSGAARIRTRRSIRAIEPSWSCSRALRPDPAKLRREYASACRCLSYARVGRFLTMG